MYKEIVDKVWNLAKPIPGRDCNYVRQDPYGKVIKKNAYGQPYKDGSWDIDHIRPKSRGGSNNINNLQALSSSINRGKGNSLIKKSRHNQ
jgi:hypothetical protein